jgi:RNA polymerase sigma-70 factor (ECF subfamily)
MTLAFPRRMWTLDLAPFFLAAPNKPHGAPSTPSKNLETVDMKGASGANPGYAHPPETPPASTPIGPPSGFPDEPPDAATEADETKLLVARLVSKAKKGDRDAYRQLVERYQKRVFAIVFGMLHSREDAMELSQDVFVKVYRRIAEFEEKSSFYTWVYRIAVNLAIDFRRREWKKVHTEYDDSMADDGLDDGVFQRDRRSPEQLTQDKELGAEIQRALDTLPEEQRKVLVMREIEGMAYQEMADVMECSIGTIMSRLFYARKKMQAALKGLEVKK